MTGTGMEPYCPQGTCPRYEGIDLLESAGLIHSNLWLRAVIVGMENMLLNDKKTLAQRLSEGRLPVAEALRYAMQLADCLRKLHDTGKVHGAVTPSNLVLAAGGVELLPAAEGWGEAITPYTAPEVVQGRPADASSDVFGFGAILFEMMTGRRAFDGESRVALAANLTETPAPSSGSPIVDRLVGPCLNKNPDARSPRMQMVMLELKLLMVAVRRAAPGAGGAPRRAAAVDTGAVRAEMQHLEARLEARLQVQEKGVSEMHRSANEAVSSLRMEVAAMKSELAANRHQALEPKGGGLDDESNEVISSRLDRGFEVLNARIEQIERTVEAMRRHTSQFANNIVEDLADIEHNGKKPCAPIESARKATSQTEDLVERVVEALESLQTEELDRDEGGERSGSVVN